MRPSEITNVRSILLRSPTAEDLEEQELDVDLIPNSQVDVVLTDRAAEVLPLQTHRNIFLTKYASKFDEYQRARGALTQHYAYPWSLEDATDTSIK